MQRVEGHAGSSAGRMCLDVRAGGAGAKGRGKEGHLPIKPQHQQRTLRGALTGEMELSV